LQQWKKQAGKFAFVTKQLVPKLKKTTTNLIFFFSSNSAKMCFFEFVPEKLWNCLESFFPVLLFFSTFLIDLTSNVVPAEFCVF